MFERGKVDSSADHGLISVEVGLEDGRQLSGKVSVPPGRTLFELLNGSSAFIEFEPFAGESMFLAKSSLRTVKLMNAGRVPPLSARLRDLDGFNPFTVLGVTNETPWDQVRSAYLTLAKTYHPDRFSSVDLPAEIQSYLAAISRRVNLAYTTLEASHLQRKETASAKQAPVYTSQRR
jgi:hypothetical protein